MILIITSGIAYPRLSDFRKMLGPLLPAIVVILLLSGGCARSDPSATDGAGVVYSKQPARRGEKELRFAIHPLHNPAKMTANYHPLMQYLEERMQGVKFDLETSRNYQDFEGKITSREPDIILPNPWQALLAMKHGYEVIAIAGDPADFKGLLLVRKDGGLRTVADLRGRTVAYPAATALAACIMPQWYMHTHGIDVNHDISNRFVGSQESSIMNAVMGQAAAAATWPPPWRAFQKEHPAEAAQLAVLLETPPLINNAVMVKDDVPDAVRQQVKELLVGMDKNAEGRAVLAGFETRYFLPGTSADYEVVRNFIQIFEKEVRLIQP